MSHHTPRYQCPHCQRFHPDALKPGCSVHGRDGYSAGCQECVHSAANPPCGPIAEIGDVSWTRVSV